jgi:hypothetical protein
MVSTAPRLPWAVLAIMMLLAGGWMLYLIRGGTFHYDEWNFVLNRRGHSADTFLMPHNEHLVAVPVFIFKSLFETFGLSHYWPYQLLPVGLHLLCTLLVYVLARRRLGDWWALLPAGLVLFFGAAWEDILWSFQIGFLIPVAAFLGALLLLDRRDIRGDLAAAILVAAGVGSSGFGVPLAVGVATFLAFGPNRVVRMIGIVGIPLALFLAWDSQYGVSQFPWESVPDLPRLIIDLLAGTLAAVFGLSPQFGPILAILFALALAQHVLRNRPLTPTLAAALMGAVASLAVLALFRGGSLTSRYYYPGGVLLILALVELAPTNLPRRVTARGIAVAGVASTVILSTQVGLFLDGGKFFRDWARFVPTSLGALEIARDHVDPAFRPDPVRAPDIDARKYFDTTKDFGSPADSPAEILRRPEDARQNADSVLAAALRIGLAPAPRPEEPAPIPQDAARASETAETRDGCLIFAPETPRSSVEVRLGRGLWVRPEQGANAEVRLRRFGAGYPPADEPPGKALFAVYVRTSWGRDFIRPLVLRPPEGAGSAIAIPADKAPNIPWYARITTDELTQICALGS